MNIRDIEKAAVAQGWQVGRTARGHIRFVPPDASKKIVIGSGTPSDARSISNLLAELRRQGFVWPWPPKGEN